MGTFNKPPTAKARVINEWIRITFLSPYLHRIPKNEKTLDLGCGWGFSFKINPGFYGIEIDDACVNYCQEQGYKVVRGSLLEPLPFPDEFFDNCFTHDVLEHFKPDETKTIFMNVNKVLKKNKHFINIIPNKKGYDYGLSVNTGHQTFVTPEKVRELAEETGFKFLRVYSAPVPGLINPWFTHAKYVTICEKK